MKVLGFALIILSIILCIAESAHFGWNFLPGSRNELISDLFCVALFIVGNIMTKIKE